MQKVALTHEIEVSVLAEPGLGRLALGVLLHCVGPPAAAGVLAKDTERPSRARLAAAVATARLARALRTVMTL
jgi:hypothetical protein